MKIHPTSLADDAELDDPDAWENVPAWTRRLATVAIVLHLLAVIVPPLSVAPASMLARDAFLVLRPYIDLVYLDHGYRFFAPEPGPSHLIRYELEMADGTSQEGVLPNLDEHWPRLLYHRHFMLTEFVNNLSGMRPEVERAYVRSYARHLMYKSGATRVRLYLRRHQIPEPQQILEGMSPTDPRFYEERVLGTFSRVAT